MCSAELVPGVRHRVETDGAQVPSDQLLDTCRRRRTGRGGRTAAALLLQTDTQVSRNTDAYVKIAPVHSN